MKKFFVLCLGLTIAIYFIGSCSASPIYKSMEGEAFAKCKDLCKMCSCSGFSCGNECICECKYKDDQNVNCVDDMQNNLEKMKAPFDVLIQGPSGKRFIRNADSKDEVTTDTMSSTTETPSKLSEQEQNAEQKPIESSDKTDSAQKSGETDTNQTESKDETKSTDATKVDDSSKTDVPEPEPEASEAPEKSLRKRDTMSEDESKSKDAAKEDDSSKTDEAKDDAPEPEPKPEMKAEAGAESEPEGSERPLRKRDTLSDLEADAEAISNPGVSADTATLDENTNRDEVKPLTVSSTEPTVGSALLPGLLGLKKLQLKNGLALGKIGKLGLLGAGAPLLNPILNPVVGPGIAGIGLGKLAGLKAKLAGLGLGLPILPIVPPIL